MTLDIERKHTAIFDSSGSLMTDEKMVSVIGLWERLQTMEKEKRFDGLAYPTGRSCFPFRLTGQGFFPGGDGLWRDDVEVSQASSGLAAIDGIMFLGNDFGTLKSFEKLRLKGFENPLTWKHIKRRIARAELPVTLTFFTNAVMGLRASGNALDKRDWDLEPRFNAYCREFLIFQIETLKPRLIVVLGPSPRSTLVSLGVASTTVSGKFLQMRVGSHLTTVFFSTHPYGDFNFDKDRKSRDGFELREAWDRAQSRDCY